MTFYAPYTNMSMILLSFSIALLGVGSLQLSADAILGFLYGSLLYLDSVEFEPPISYSILR